MTPAPPLPERPRPGSLRPTDARGDAQLVLAVLAGDASAFEAIMRRHNRLMFRTARSLVDDDAEAQDVVQESYLRAFTAMAAYRGEAALSTWLVRIAIHQAISAQRRKGRLVLLHEPQPRDGAASDAESDAENAMSIPESSASAQPETPEARTLQAQTRLLLERAIGQLPPIYRSVFMLRAVEELSVDDTAAALAVSQEVVKTRFLRARAMLRELLQADIHLPPREVYAFAGERCDEVVGSVLAALQARGLIRPH